jgi:hypothetical protein
MVSISFPPGHPFHQAGAVPFFFARINDQMHAVRHQATGIDSATIGVLPSPKICR